MRRFTLGLALSAIPAAACGQDVSCSGCDHVAPWFRGEGGFIGTLAEDAGEVVFVASCGSVSTTGEAQVDGGTAVLLFNHRNGLACDREGGSLEIAGLKDGGWYWITDNLNSAVGNLVAKDILGNEPTDITSAGSGVTMTAGKGAVYLQETATGRVGILPNILPEPPTAPTRKCGYSGSGTAASPAKPVKTSCALGDGKTMVLMTNTNAITGATVQIQDKASITRPAGTGSVVLVADLWGNGSGHYVTTHDDASNGLTAFRGQQGLGLTAARAGARYTGVTYAVNVSTGGPGTGNNVSPDGDGSGTARGVSWTEASSAATVTVKADSAVCSKTANYATTVTLTANMTNPNDANQVVPTIVRNADSDPAGKVGSASFTIVCP